MSLLEDDGAPRDSESLPEGVLLLGDDALLEGELEPEADRDPDAIAPLDEDEGEPRLRELLPEPLPAGEEPSPPADAEREPARELDAEPLDAGVDDRLRSLPG
jgi:hypothetical protein